MSWNTRKADNGEEISNLFASFFKSIYENNNEVPLNQCNKLSIDSEDFNINFDEVYKQLTSLNVKKGAGPDGLPNLFLKNCAAGLCEPITHI